jgi:methionyl-tRNA formyltransferase
MKQRVIYIGTSTTIVPLINKHPSLQLEQVICEAKRVGEEHIQTYLAEELPLRYFETKQKFIEIVSSFDPKEFVFIIYQLDLIVPASLTRRYRFFNLHAGTIATNRGAHPIIRSILNGDKETDLTFHEINEKIDQGVIVGTHKVDISEEDNPITIKQQMEAGIPDLLDKLISYLKGEITGEEVSGGIYYKPISEIDFTLNLWKDSKETIQNKIRSQIQYFGAVVNHEEKKYHVNSLLTWKETQNEIDEVLISEEQIAVKRKSESFTLKMSTR